MRVPAVLMTLVLVGVVVWLLLDGAPAPVVDDETPIEDTPIEDAISGTPSPSNALEGDDPRAPTPNEPNGEPVPNSKPDDQPKAIQERFERAPLEPRVLTETRSWRDGRSQRVIYYDARVLVEVNPKNGSLRTGRPPVAGARLVSDQGVRRWQLPDDNAEEVVKELSQNNSETEYSIALHGRPASGGALKVPLSTLQLKFPPSWGAEEVEAFADREQLKGLKKLLIEPNWYSVQTQSGVDALAKAAELMEGGEILAAEPDWLESRQPK